MALTNATLLQASIKLTHVYICFPDDLDYANLQDVLDQIKTTMRLQPGTKCLVNCK